MNRMRTALRALCIVGTLWSLLCAVASCFLLSNVPLVSAGPLEAAGLVLHAGTAYAAAGTVLLVASIVSCCVCLFGLRCARLVRRMDALRAVSLVGSVLFLVSLVACLVIGLLYEIGWTAAVGSALLFATASLAGEVSRALVAARMRTEADDA